MLKVKNNITWVGKVDWELRRFHGNEYSTHRGSSYNSYLIREDRVALIDTVWAPFASEYVANLEQVIDLKKIDFVIANHGEVDHSGSLPELMSRIPDVPVYCTANGVKSLKGQYHRDWNFKTVKTGDRLSLGAKELVFVEAPMLHWPDSMMCYLTGDNVLFSNDAFGQHYANDLLFNDLVDQEELHEESIKYYANILTPFSALVEKKINEVVGLNVPIDIIAPSHGVIWRKDPLQIVQKYMAWAQDYQEDQITILYDSMWDGTRVMAENIALGIRKANPSVTLKVFNIAKTDKNDVITQVFKSRLILVGSPTIGKGVSFATAGILEMIEGMRFKNKKAASFGAYGWSGEAIEVIRERLEKGGFEIVNPGLKCLWNPDVDAIKACVQYGEEIGRL